LHNPVDDTLRAVPAYATQESHSFTAKSGFMGFRHSSIEVVETCEIVTPAIIPAFAVFLSNSKKQIFYVVIVAVAVCAWSSANYSKIW
jgi:predicted aconitase